MAVKTGRVALVTGASSGIGEAAARALVGAGFTVYGTSRKATAGEKREEVVFLPLDVTDDESAADAVREVLDRSGRIDVLVNNAGVGVAGAAEESSVEQARALFETNLFGAMRMTRAVLPHMRQQGSGRIINVSSIVGLIPVPFMALYASSKHALEGYSESVDHELREHGVRVLLVEPGFTNTGFDASLAAADQPLPLYARRREIVDVGARGRAQGRRRTIGRGPGHRRRGHRQTPEAAIPGRVAGAPSEQGAPLRARGHLRQADPQDQPAQPSRKHHRLLARAEDIKRATDVAPSAAGGASPQADRWGGTVIVSNAYEHAPTETVDAGGTSFAYRRLGAETGVPVIFVQHLPDRRMAI